MELIGGRCLVLILLFSLIYGEKLNPETNNNQHPNNANSTSFVGRLYSLDSRVYTCIYPL